MRIKTDMTYPELGVSVADLKMQRQLRVKLLVDTGYSGFIAIPKILIAKLQLKKFSKVEYLIAGGGSQIVSTYKALVQLPFLSEMVWVVEIDEDDSNQDFLIGSKLVGNNLFRHS